MKKNVLVNNLSLSDRWLGETEAPETEESEGWKEKGEEDWNWGKPETWEMWELYSCCFWEYMAHIFMKIDQMSDRRIFSLIQGVVIGLPGCEYWIYLCVFRSRGAHWAGEPPAFSCFWISSSERLTGAAPRVPAGTPVSSERQPFIR